MKLKNHPFLLLSAVAIVIFSTGCPYESPVPLSEQGAQVPANILGVWIDSSELDEPVEQQTTYTVTVEAGNQILITKSETDGAGDVSLTTYRGHLTLVGDDYFLNVKDLASAEMGWMEDEENAEEDPEQDAEVLYSLFKLEISGKRMRVRSVTSNMEEMFATPAELYGFVERHKDLSFFYTKDDDLVLIHSSVFRD
ncbi:MAG: hypothetical protein RJA19_1241 [Bacteroidota bacterium]|jgi:hypothetical protein